MSKEEAISYTPLQIKATDFSHLNSHTKLVINLPELHVAGPMAHHDIHLLGNELRILSKADSLISHLDRQKSTEYHKHVTDAMAPHLTMMATPLFLLIAGYVFEYKTASLPAVSDVYDSSLARENVISVLGESTIIVGEEAE